MLTIKEIEKQIQDEKAGSVNGVTVNGARPENVVAHKTATWESAEMLSFRESVKRKFGFDFADREKFPAHKSNFSWRKAAEKLTGGSVGFALKEAEGSSGFAQLLRAGVNAELIGAYQTVETTHESWVAVKQSTKDTELYAPLQGISFPREVGKQERYPESQIVGLDIKLKNRKFGQTLAIESELLENDQTGQMSQQAAQMGQYLKLLVEVICYGKLASVANMSYGGLSISPTETQPSDESTYPWSTNLVGGGSNRPASFGILNQANLQAGFIALMNQKDKLGLKMMVNPNRIICGPAERFNISVLLNSAYFPSVPSASAGAVGANFAINPIQGIAALTVSRFMFNNSGSADGSSKAWYLVDDSKPWFICQMRSGPIVTAEAPNSGESFERDVMRYKASIQFNADFLDSRFAYQGNDGSVTS